jgi:hypothetical protein
MTFLPGAMFPGWHGKNVVAAEGAVTRRNVPSRGLFQYAILDRIFARAPSANLVEKVHPIFCQSPVWPHLIYFFDSNP